jgi:y4mF family transcriptional regulator
MTPQEIAKIVHYYRKQSHLTQKQLAELSGIGKTAVFDIEKGKPTIQLDTLLKVLEVLNIKWMFELPFPMEHKE